MTKTAVKFDEHGQVVNDPETYKAVAKVLQIDGSVMLGWTDEEYTHFDILLTFQVRATYGTGTIQGGVKPAQDLFVSIMRKGAFGFTVNDRQLHADYIAEKLGLSGNNVTTRKLAELIEGIRQELIV